MPLEKEGDQPAKRREGGAHVIFVNVELYRRASASLVAPSSPILLPSNLREEQGGMRSRREGGRSSPNLCQCRVISKGFGESGGSLVTDIITNQPEGRARRNEIEKGGRELTKSLSMSSYIEGLRRVWWLPRHRYY
jgi:hypothetical protein